MIDKFSILQDIESAFLTGTDNTVLVRKLRSVMESENMSAKESRFWKRAYNRAVSLNRRSINEGFFNPFEKPSDIHGYASVPDIVDSNDSGDVKILKVRLWNPDVTDKTYYNKGCVCAGRHFAKGDVIERCPVRAIDGRELSSMVMREYAFPLSDDRRTYGIPFGKAAFYSNSKESGKEPNVTYRYDDSPDGRCDGIIIITAMRKINPNDELVIFSSDEDFANEFNDSDFDYKATPPREIKNVRLI